MRMLFPRMLTAAWVALALAGAVRADDVEPDHVRGQISGVDAGSVTIKTKDGRSLRLSLPEGLAVFALTKASFSNIDFGQYVGSVAVKLDITDPIVRATPRETIGILFQGHELRILDEKLRGIAVGFKKWDVPNGGSMTHGWVDDMDGRTVTIKYGPQRHEQSDVLVGKDMPITRMSLGDRGDIKAGAHVFAGATKGPDGKLGATFVFVGKDGLVPSL
jgi:hypothetical protein